MDSDPSPELPPQPLQATPPGLYDRLRNKFVAWAARKGPATSGSADALLVLPDLVCLLSGLTLDSEVPPRQKAKVALALLYLASPLDFLPEAIFGPFACLDDVIVAVIVLNNLLNHVEPHVIQRHWRGDGDAIRLIRHLVAVADELAGSGLLRRVKRFLES